MFNLRAILILGHLFVAISAACAAISPSLADPLDSPLNVQYEYQVRLDPKTFISRDQVILNLYEFLGTVDLGEYQLKLIDDAFKPKSKVQQVEYFDTLNAELATQGVRIRRRQNLGARMVQMTFKVNRPVFAGLETYRFETGVPVGVQLKEKLEKDIYSDQAMVKWAYSATLESKNPKSEQNKLPTSTQLNTMAVLSKWFPQVKRLNFDRKQALMATETEYHWRASLAIELDGIDELDLTFPYLSEKEAIEGEALAIDAEVSWRAPAEDHASSLALKKLIAEAWGE
jgi:hypothetical protein